MWKVNYDTEEPDPEPEPAAEEEAPEAVEEEEQEGPVEIPLYDSADDEGAVRYSVIESCEAN